MTVFDEWISLVDAYPPIGQNVLVLIRGGSFDIAAWTGQYWYPRCDCMSYESSMNPDVLGWARLTVPVLSEADQEQCDALKH